MKGYSRLFLLSAYGLKWVHAEANVTVASFGHPFSIAGENARSEVEVSNELTIDAYSATTHKITVTRNHPSATADYVTAYDTSSTGLLGSWVALNKYSYRVRVDDGQSDADDMIVNLEAKYDPAQLQSKEIGISNVYLGRYNATRAGWVIDNERANVQINENHARIMGLNSADGEYMLLGRVTDESQNIFIQFSSAPAGVTNWTVNAPSSATGTPEPPLQIGVWADGLRLLVRSSTQLTVTADIQKAPVKGLPEGYSVISPWSYNITSTEDDSCSARVQLPYSSSWLSRQNLNPSQVVIGSRNSSTENFTIHPVTSTSNSAFLMTNTVSSFSGEYVLMGSPSLKANVDLSHDNSACNCAATASASASASASSSYPGQLPDCRPIGVNTHSSTPTDSNSPRYPDSSRSPDSPGINTATPSDSDSPNSSGYPAIGSGSPDMNNTSSPDNPGTNTATPSDSDSPNSSGYPAIGSGSLDMNNTSSPDSPGTITETPDPNSINSPDYPAVGSGSPGKSNTISPESPGTNTETPSDSNIPRSSAYPGSPDTTTTTAPGSSTSNQLSPIKDCEKNSTDSTPVVTSGDGTEPPSFTPSAGNLTPTDVNSHANYTQSDDQSPNSQSNGIATPLPDAGNIQPTSSSSKPSETSDLNTPPVSSGNDDQSLSTTKVTSPTETTPLSTSNCTESEGNKPGTNPHDFTTLVPGINQDTPKDPTSELPVPDQQSPQVSSGSDDQDQLTPTPDESNNAGNQSPASSGDVIPSPSSYAPEPQSDNSQAPYENTPQFSQGDVSPTSGRSALNNSAGTQGQSSYSQVPPSVVQPEFNQTGAAPCNETSSKSMNFTPSTSWKSTSQFTMNSKDLNDTLSNSDDTLVPSDDQSSTDSLPPNPTNLSDIMTEVPSNAHNPSNSSSSTVTSYFNSTDGYSNYNTTNPAPENCTESSIPDNSTYASNTLTNSSIGSSQSYGMSNSTSPDTSSSDTDGSDTSMGSYGDSNPTNPTESTESRYISDAYVPNNTSDSYNSSLPKPTGYQGSTSEAKCTECEGGNHGTISVTNSTSSSQSNSSSSSQTSITSTNSNSTKPCQNLTLQNTSSTTKPTSVQGSDDILSVDVPSPFANDTSTFPTDAPTQVHECKECEKGASYPMISNTTIANATAHASANASSSISSVNSPYTSPSGANSQSTGNLANLDQAQNDSPTNTNARSNAFSSSNSKAPSSTMKTSTSSSSDASSSSSTTSTTVVQPLNRSSKRRSITLNR